MELDRVARASRPSGHRHSDGHSLGRDAQATLVRSPRVRLSRIAILLLAALPWPAAFAYLAHFERHAMRVRAYWAANPNAPRSFTSFVWLSAEARVVCCALVPLSLMIVFWIREARVGPLATPHALAAVPFSPGRHLAKRFVACELFVAAAVLPALLILEGFAADSWGGNFPCEMIAVASICLPLPVLLASTRQTPPRTRLGAVALLGIMAWPFFAGLLPICQWGLSLLGDIGSILWFGMPRYFPIYFCIYGMLGVFLLSLPWAWRAWSRMFREEAP